MAAGAGSVVCPFVQAPAAGVHEEVADRSEFEAKLLRDGELHLLGWPLVLLEDGQQGAALQVGEDQPGLLWRAVALLRRVLLLPFARCGVGGQRGQREWKAEGRRRERQRMKALVLFVQCEQPVNIGGGFGSVS